MIFFAQSTDPLRPHDDQDHFMLLKDNFEDVHHPAADHLADMIGHR